MRGKGNEKIDRGNWLDSLLRRVARLGAWASSREEERCNRRRLAVAWPSGTRVLITGTCCAGSYANRQGAIHSYVVDADDYRITLDNVPGWPVPYHTYACLNGMVRTGEAAS